MSATTSPLMMKIEACLPNMSHAETLVARYILEHPTEIIGLSITALAAQSGASEATVVRFCRRLGMQGYQELKVTLAQDVVSPIETIHEEVTESDSDMDVLSKVFASTIHSLEYTLHILRKPEFERAISLLNGARLINIYGCGNSASVAQDMQHKLMRLGLRASAYSDSHMQCIASTMLGEGDVCVAISHSGSSRDVVDAARLAKSRGASVIAMSNIGRSPLGDLADVRLDTASKETSYHIVALSSRIAQYTIIDSLYSALAVRRHHTGQDQALSLIEKALSTKKY